MKKAILLILLLVLFILPIFGCKQTDNTVKDKPPASSTEGLVPATPVQNGGQFEVK